MFTENEVLRICKYYTNKDISLELLGVSHNIVYKIFCSNSFILRFTPLKHRNKEEIIAEIDFLNFLHQNGANVNNLVPTLNNLPIVDCEIQNESYYATAFTLCEGLNWKERSDDENIVGFIGQELGKIHRISKKYNPCNVVLRRNCVDSQHLTKGFLIFKKYDIRLYSKFLSFIDELKTITKDNQSYGLTHGDFLFCNYNITQDNKVSVYDFDECEYSWFISDIAVCIYYYLLGGNPSELIYKTDEAKHLLCQFMAGYNKENIICNKQFEKIDLFFKQRDYILLSTIIGRGTELGWWDKLFVEGALDRILNDKPFIDLKLNELNYT